MSLNLYLVTRTDGITYEEFDSFICAAKSAYAASQMNPAAENNKNRAGRLGYTLYTGWITPDETSTLSVQLIGTALPDAEPSVILASYNAG